MGFRLRYRKSILGFRRQNSRTKPTHNIEIKYVNEMNLIALQ